MSVKLFFWNVRGLNEPNKHKPFYSWLNSQQPLFGAVLESHIKEPSLNPILSHLCPGWKLSSNHASDYDGRIILIWRDSLNVQIISQSSQCITCWIYFPNQASIVFSAIYAFNECSDRDALWVELLTLHQDLDLDNHCWIIGGDLN